MKRSRPFAASALVTCAALCGALSAPPATAQERLSEPGGSSQIWGDARGELVQRVFGGVLGRPPGPAETARATEEVRDGRLGELIGELVASSEYRDRRGGPEQLLERFFRGLLDRSPEARESYLLGRELERRRDAEVIRRLVDSEEFRRVLDRGPAVDGGPAAVSAEQREESATERACREALDRRVSEDLGRSVGLRLLAASVTESTVLSELLEGRAELDEPQGQTLTFTCRVDRFGNHVAETTYELEQGATSELLVRCESQNLRPERCPVDTSGGVVLERQEGRAPCIEGQTWGYDGEGIWVQLGCRGLFRVAVAADVAGLESRVDGWGFVRQGDDRADWLSVAAVALEPGGVARLELSGAGTARFTGRWYEAGESQVGITLDGPAGSDRPIGAGQLRLRNRELEYLELAGVTGGESFDIVFTRRLAAAPMRFHATGKGFAELADGRRFHFDRATIDLGNDGRVSLRFTGESDDTLTGSWFVGWGNPIQLAIDGPGEATAGFGTLHRSDDDHFELQISGVAGEGQSFRIEFVADR